MQKFKYIGLDLDGTLLDSKKNIDKETISYISKLRNLGYVVILMSGRHYEEVLPYINLLSLTSHDYVISSDGEYIYQCDGILLRKSNFLTSDDVFFILNHMHIDTMCVVSNTQNYIYTPSVFKRMKICIKNILLNQQLSCFRRPLDVSSLQIEKIIFSNLKDLHLFPPIVLNKYSVTIIEGKYVQLLPYNINKYTSLQKLRDIKGFNLDNLLYFGNDDNDAECIANLTSVAMLNSTSKIKSMANYVTDTCDNQGVLKALKQILNE